MSTRNNSQKGSKHPTLLAIIGLISPRAKQGVEVVPTLMERARRIAVPLQVVLALGGLGVAVWYGIQWNKTSKNLSNRIQTSLKEKLDNTVWQHKGFAAYLLSDIEGRSTQPTAVVNSPAHDEFLTKIRCIEAIANKEAARQIVGSTPLRQEIDNLTIPESQTVVTDEPADRTAGQESRENNCRIPDQKELKFEISGTQDRSRSHQAVMVDGGSDFFIFVPAMALHYDNDSKSNPELTNLFYDSAKRSDEKIKEGLRAALMVNPDIVRDLDLAKRLSGKLKELDNSLINGNEVVQSYFIAESGLILIRSKDVKNQLALYEPQFPKAYYFPDRAYVLGALQGRDTQRLKAIGLDYESEPYIDLGGHGLVKTFSKKLKLANGRYGVICVDVNRSDLKGKIKERLDVLRIENDPYQESTIVINNASIKGPNGTDRQALPPDFQWFSGKLLEKLSKSDRSETAELLGRIAAQEDIEQVQDTKILRYTIPLSTELADEGRKVTLMLVTIDFEGLWALQNRRLIYLCIGVMVFIGITINIFQDSFFLRKEISELMERLDRVMEHAKNPYARVNGKNEFVAVNRCFLNVLGYGNKDSLEHEKWGAPSGRTFLSILDPPSQDKYKENLRISESGVPAKPYSVSMYKKDESMLRVQVYGERIPFPTIFKERYPQRFGIFLDWTAIDTYYNEMLAKELDRDIRIINNDEGDGGKFEIQFKNQADRERLSSLLRSIADFRTKMNADER